MKISQAFPSTYLKAADLQGHDVRVAIRDIKFETLGSGQDAEQKAILYFQGKDRGLVLNKTNAQTIAHAYGDETDDWIGQEIELYTAMVQFQSQMVEAIRVRVPRRKPQQTITSGPEQLRAAKPSQGSSAALADDDIPFEPEMRG